MIERPDLHRFVDAQSPIYDRALAELKAGRKESPWMWFIFPQLLGLGRSEAARIFGIVDREEVLAFLAHPLLGPRLRQCSEAAAAHRTSSAEAIFGETDAMKFRSSMTLFEAVAATGGTFSEALRPLCGGVRDAVTLRLLGGQEA